MVTTPLVQYIRQQVTLGEDPQEIVAELQARNWSAGDINEAFRSAGSWVKTILAERGKATSIPPAAASQAATVSMPASTAPQLQSDAFRDLAVSPPKSGLQYIFASALAVMVLAGGAWSYILTTPNYSLYKFYQAIEAGSYNDFAKYAKPEGLLATNAASETAPNASLQQLRNKVETSVFLSEYEPVGMSAYAFIPVEKGQQFARVTLKSKNGATIPIIMERTGNHWRVISTSYQL